MDGTPVICCQGKNGVMSETAAVLNDAGLFIPEQEERSAAASSGRETPS